MESLRLYQIFYNDETRAAVEDGFIPLDNRDNPRPDWYEFYVIRKFLLNNKLDGNCWYGFFSPRFREKTTLGYADLRQFTTFSEGKADVALVGVGWDQIAYFRNPFEQGEVFHPGLTELSQFVVDRLGYAIDLRNSVSHTGSFAFSNFVIAKPAYWQRWLNFANEFFDLVENDTGPLPDKIRGVTRYLTDASPEAPFKTFIQERMVFPILLAGGYRTCTYVLHDRINIYDRLFARSPLAKARLLECDRLKRLYLKSGDRQWLDAYYEVRSGIYFRPLGL